MTRKENDQIRNMNQTRLWDTPFPSRITPSLIRQWTKDFPTPFYVYDQKTLERRIKEVKNFPRPIFSSFTPRYALKANPSRALIEIFNKAGIFFDASSSYEVERLIKIGISPNKILLTSQKIPLQDKKFTGLFRRGLIYNATSLRQLEWYGKLCPGKKVSLRINPGFGSGMHFKTTVGGMNTGFGIWHEHYPEIIRLCHKYQITVERIHTHVGSGSNPETWAKITKSTLNLLQYFPTASILNIGGGFKVGRHPGERSTDLNKVGTKVSELMETYSKKNNHCFDLEIEPGTYFVAEMGILIAQVEDVVIMGKKNPKRFIKLNIGMNDLIRPTLYHSRHHIDIIPLNVRKANKTGKEKFLPYIVIGHCCESGDQISQHIDGVKKGKAEMYFVPPQPGDIVIIHGAGAYCSAMSSRYNSYPLIAEYLFDKKLIPIRKAESLEQMMSLEISLNAKR